METTDFVNYPTAKKLKALGFNLPCLSFYNAGKELGRALDPDNFNHLGETYQGEWFTDAISAPTLWQAQKWLRSKGLEVYAIIARGATYEWGVYHIPTHDNIACNMGPNYESYEAALSEGIACALELIEKGE